jgi:hypothetical protein
MTGTLPLFKANLKKKAEKRYSIHPLVNILIVLADNFSESAQLIAFNVTLLLLEFLPSNDQ